MPPYGCLAAWSKRRSEVLTEAGSDRISPPGRWRNLLTLSEIGLAVVLVVGSGLLVRSFILLMNVDPGFNATHLPDCTDLVAASGIFETGTAGGVSSGGVAPSESSPGGR